MKTLHRDISDACRRTDNVLWDAHAQSVKSQLGVFSSAASLIFTQYRDKRGGALRVSEQEARFAFVEALCQGPLMYSVEAPTTKRYQFTGKTKISANTDLTIHDQSGIRICNVEFKAKGVSPSARNHFHIYKDLQKLLREPVWGLWFHLLERTDNSTINNLWRVMSKQIGEVQREFGKDIESPGLTLHVCVLGHRFSLQRDVPLPHDRVITEAELDGHLSVDLKVSRSELVEVHNLNGWELHRL